MRSKAVRCALLVCVLCCGGCNGGGVTQNADITGAWQVAGISKANGTGMNIEMNLSETNGVVSSTAFLGFGSCPAMLGADVAVTGTVAGSKVSLTASYLNATLSLTGTVSGQAIAGTYNCETDSGTWTARQMALLSGTYGGTLKSDSSGQATPISIFVNANSSYSITGSTTPVPFCFGPLALSGTQIGGFLGITGTDVMGDSVFFELTSTDASFGHLFGRYVVTAGNCVGHGSAVMSK